MRSLVLLVLSALLATPLSATAFNRGMVLVEVRSHIKDVAGDPPTYQLWLTIAGPFTVSAGGWRLIDKPIPFNGSGRFLMPTPDQVLFHTDQTVSFWDGVVRPYTDPGLGYTPIFHDDATLSEIAPMRSGNFLVAERNGNLIEFNVQGRVAEYPLGGAEHIELLADQCTVLFTRGNADENRVGRYNICAGQPQTDFATLLAGQYAGAIRQLPGGDVLVANGNVILRFTAQGSLVGGYAFSGVTHLALAADGKSFWASGVDLDALHLRHFALDGTSESIAIGNPGMKSIEAPLDVNDLVVVGEWRAATATAAPKPRNRAVSR